MTTEDFITQLFCRADDKLTKAGKTTNTARRNYIRLKVNMSFTVSERRLSRLGTKWRAVSKPSERWKCQLPKEKFPTSMPNNKKLFDNDADFGYDKI